MKAPTHTLADKPRRPDAGDPAATIVRMPAASMELPFQEPPAPPLAERLRPRTLDEMIGQQHLLGAGKPLRVAFESGRLHSMILWGPPGVGKTTVARLVAQGFDAQFIAMSAVLGGVKDIREAVERAQATQSQGRRTVVFVDEVHRFNKAQQDAFLPHVESGLFTFIGATTENPSFEVNSALLSRSKVHVLKPLETAHVVAILRRALTDEERGLGREGIAAEDEALAGIARYANGDARVFIHVDKTRTGDPGEATAPAFPVVQSGEGVGLIEVPEGQPEVAKFADHRVLHFRQAHDQPDHEQRGDQHQFGGDHKARFVARELLQHESSFAS